MAALGRTPPSTVAPTQDGYLHSSASHADPSDAMDTFDVAEETEQPAAPAARSPPIPAPDSMAPPVRLPAAPSLAAPPPVALSVGNPKRVVRFNVPAPQELTRARAAAGATAAATGDAKVAPPAASVGPLAAVLGAALTPGHVAASSLAASSPPASCTDGGERRPERRQELRDERRDPADVVAKKPRREPDAPQQATGLASGVEGASGGGGAPRGVDKAGLAQLVKSLLNDRYRSGRLSRDDFKDVARRVTVEATAYLASTPSADEAEIRHVLRGLVREALASV